MWVTMVNTPIYLPHFTSLGERRKKLSQAANLPKNEREKSPPEWFLGVCLRAFQWCSEVICTPMLPCSKAREILVSICLLCNMWPVFPLRVKNRANESEQHRMLQSPRMPGTGNVEAVLIRQTLHTGQLLAADEMHAPHVKWPLARSATTTSRNSLCPLPLRDKAGTCIPSAHQTLDANPGLILADWGWNSLASFTGNSHASTPW